MKIVNGSSHQPAMSAIRYVSLLLFSVCLVLTPIAGVVTMSLGRSFWMGVKAVGETSCILGGALLAFALLEMLISRRQSRMEKSTRQL